ncbi:MAG: pyruvate:ferredoxin (flavodoxin) oxidoreductase [Proteobacteria bacterium]|jgi:pyruvate-ferredoxin/flavodoxin oxidoreductase|nr:pyruvate:ferredoxin (flavodoxin) oxidoreductase [Pseudomonadota bacterium]
MGLSENVTWDANEATAYVAYRVNEVVSIYPITPASPMGEHADAWSAEGLSNLWGDVPEVVEMQSEGGAAGAVHGSAQAGAMTTTFTASQGLLLMIPNMYKLAGELTSAVIHVSARSVATHALSIFGDHSDIYAARQTGWGMLCSNSVQEAHDFALIAQAMTLRTRLPFIHFFDGFRTSHEVSKTTLISDEQMLSMIDSDAAQAHQARGMSPDRPFIRGTAQNPDVFFQAREAVNPYYEAAPGILEDVFAEFAQKVGRTYNLFDYHGHPEADRVMVIMGSGAEAVHETVDWMLDQGEKVGVLKVRVYRPFSAKHFLAALPKSVKVIGVLDRTKEPGAPAEPLHLDIIAALSEMQLTGDLSFPMPAVVGGRYGLSSKEFNPAMIVGVYKALGEQPLRNHFTVGILDDVTNHSLPWDAEFDIEADDVMRAVFFGLGADGTVGANKNSIKIIGEETDNFAQGYFVYDSKKSGAVTISHLRFGPRPIRSTYLIKEARFVGCHQPQFLERYDVLDYASPGAVFLLNTAHGPDEVWDTLPIEVQNHIINKNLVFWVIDGYAVADKAGMGQRINTIMQTCFFAISGILPRDEAIEQIKKAIKKTYGRKGDAVVQANYAVVDASVENLYQVEVPDQVTSTHKIPSIVPDWAPEEIQRVNGMIMEGKGDLLPVSCFAPDGTWPTATTQYEKRRIARDIPVWNSDLCIQCGKCSLICPHAAVRTKVYDPKCLDGAPTSFKSMTYKAKAFRGQQFTVQVSPEDCTGCTLCSLICSGKEKKNPDNRALLMDDLLPHLEDEQANLSFFLKLPEVDRTKVKFNVKESQLLRPLFEFSGACAGCGETPYVKLATQLFGDRMYIANATGCSSIFGGNLPSTPYCVDENGRGPTWSNSLFEDNAEFGMGFRLAVDQLGAKAQRLTKSLASQLGDELVTAVMEADQGSEEGIIEQRARVDLIRQKLADLGSNDAAQLNALADYLVRKSVWIVGGDGWAYDIGYGGLDHALASGRDLNILVLDTQVYSNTGGQASKATPLGAVAKFAAGGKDIQRKDLGMIAMAYGNVYVAQVAMAAKDAHTVKAFVDAESYPGPSLIIAYSHCIAHGFDLAKGIEQQKKAVESGFWPLWTFDPRRAAEGKQPLKLDSKAPTLSWKEFAYNEARFSMLVKANPERAEALLNAAQDATRRRFATYEALSNMAPTPKDD